MELVPSFFGISPILTLVRSGILGIKSANPFYEALHSSLLEDTHQGRAQGLGGIGGDLGDGGFRAGVLLDVAAGYLLEFEVAGNISGDEDVGQLARRHEKLGDKVDVPVVGSAVLLPWLVAFREVTILLEQLIARIDRLV